MSERKNRPMYSGLAGVRPEPVNFGPANHVVETTAEVKATEKKLVTYSAEDQIRALTRMTIAAGSDRDTSKPRTKNNWTGH
jgi:hypothetical protein